MEDFNSFKKFMDEHEEELRQLVNSEEFQNVHDEIVNHTKSSLIDSHSPILMVREKLTSKMLDQFMKVDSQEFLVNKEVEKLSNYINMLYQLTEISEKLEIAQLRKEGA